MPTIYIDCSSTCKSPVNTGIQRVVRNIARHAGEVAFPIGYTVKLVALREGEFSEIFLPEFNVPEVGAAWRFGAAQRVRIMVLGWIDKVRHHLAALSKSTAWKDFISAPRYRFGLAGCLLYPFSLMLALIKRIRKIGVEDVTRLPWTATTDHSNDILLLADSTWELMDIWPVARRFRQRGGFVATVIYDLIPLSHPQFCDSSLVNAFTNWINKSVANTDFYICISSSTEAALRTFLLNMHGTGRTGYFHLGSDLDLTRKGRDPSQNVVDIVAGGESIFMVVGSLEPRKNLSFVLDAFDRIWQLDTHVKLVLVGHNTWKVEELLERIEKHPLLGNSLFWIRDASDTDLEYLYQHSTALVFASMVEGFGLPIVEAMQRGLPVLCSDLPVLRESADGKATFFDLDTTDQLVSAILRRIDLAHNAAASSRTVYPWLNWRESCDWLLRSVVKENCKAKNLTIHFPERIGPTA